MTDHREQLLTQLGFRFGRNGPHAARTMMLDDLRLLLGHLSDRATREDYETAVVNDNLLGKPTRMARELAFRHLATLYALDAANPVFRALRRLWSMDMAAQPLLALAAALARDPLLNASRTFFLSQTLGVTITRERVEQYLRTAFPERFSPASLKSLAQHLAGTWTAAGILNGRVRKIRTLPCVTPAAMAMLLFLGYLEGRSGMRLFSSRWMDLTGLSPDALEGLANAAAQRGLMVLMSAGGVMEVRFPDYLTAAEEPIRQELTHVV